MIQSRPGASPDAADSQLLIFASKSVDLDHARRLRLAARAAEMAECTAALEAEIIKPAAA
jgi:hypothetical protein